MPSLLWATQYARTPTPGPATPPTNSADRIPLQPVAVVLGQGEQVGDRGGDFHGMLKSHAVSSVFLR